MDGGMGEEFSIDRVLARVEHAIVIMTWPIDDFAQPASRFLTRLAFPWPWEAIARKTLATIHERYNAALARLVEEEKNGRVTIIAPKTSPVGGRLLRSAFDMDPVRIKRVMREGYRAAMRKLRSNPHLFPLGT